MRQPSHQLLVMSLTLALAFAGCEADDPIRTYNVPKHDLIQLELPNEQQVAAPTGEPTDRMLAAVVMKGKRAWFFKGTGPVSAYSDTHRTNFDQFVTSLRFSDDEGGKPSWNLPDGWTESAGSGMRLANIQMGNGVEISVIPLPVPPGNERGYLLSNVNRWRNQLRLPPLSSAELAQQTYLLTTADGEDATVADFQGWIDQSSLPPMARAASPPAGTGAGAGAGQPPTTSTASGLTYEVPEAWKEQPASGMRAAAFTLTSGDDEAEVTVIALGGAAGGVLENVNRWRGQIGLPALNDAEDLDIEELSIDSQPASYVRLDGEKSQSILAAMHPRDGKVWFIKLTGPTQIANEQQQAFEQFLSSIRFR